MLCALLPGFAVPGCYHVTSCNQQSLPQGFPRGFPHLLYLPSCSRSELFRCLTLSLRLMRIKKSSPVGFIKGFILKRNKKSRQGHTGQNRVMRGGGCGAQWRYTVEAAKDACRVYNPKDYLVLLRFSIIPKAGGGRRR